MKTLFIIVLLIIYPYLLSAKVIIGEYTIEPEANLTKADLSNANLTYSQFHGADITKANLSNANLYSSYFQAAKLNDTNLTNSQLQYANFSYADLRGANLKGANIEHAIFDNAKLDGATWVNGLKCRKGSKGSCRFIYKKKKKTVSYAIDFKGKILSNKTLDNSNFEQADLRASKFLRSSLKGVNFKGANLMGATFKSAKLQNANFEGANLTGADFRWANLEGANLEGAIIHRTRFSHATWIDGNICAKKSRGKCKIKPK